MDDLTAIILTKDEEVHIVDCLNSIKDLAKRIVVVDSGSSDKTVQLARECGADVYIHPFENYAKQFNWGLDNTDIRTKWVLRLDADERFTPKLCEEVRAKMQLHGNDDVNGFTIEAQYYFMGKQLKHAGSMKRKLMVFKYGIGRIEERNMDEHTILSSGRSIPLKGKFLHYDYKNLDFFISKLNWYASRELQDYLEYKEGKSSVFLSDEQIQKTRKRKFGLYYRMPMFLRAWMLFVYKYFFKLGFRR